MKKHTVKTIASCCAIVAACLGTANADFTISAPGFSAPYRTTELSKSWNNNLGSQWRYVIVGYTYRLNAGTPNGGKVTGNGELRYKVGERAYPGETRFSVSVNGKTIVSQSHRCNMISQTSGTVTYKLDAPLVITDQMVNVSFDYESNMIGTGDYITFHGYSLLAPPVPSGSLVAPSYVRSGGFPTLEWNINRSYEDKIVDIVITEPEVEQESSNSGHVKSNNGHGNNADGIDVSNPGKAAAKWSQRGYNDTDLNGDGVIDSADDDEATGGGSAISKTPVSNPEPTE